MKAFSRFVLLPLMLAAIGLFETPPGPPADPENLTQPPAPPTPPQGITDEIKTYIAAQIEAAKADAKAELEAQAEQERQQREAEEEAERQRKAGEFETIEQGYKDQITNLSGYKDKTEKLEAKILKQYEEDSKSIPDSLKAFQPKDDASLEDKMEWLETAKAEAAKMVPAPGQPGLRPDPKPPVPIDKVRKEMAHQDARSAVRSSI